MNQSQRVRGLLLVLVFCCQNAFAQGQKPNIVILATGGTIAGAGATGTQSAYTSGAVTIDAMVTGGFIAPADWSGAYCFTDVGQVALAEDMKDNEKV